ncbi:MAG: hypothetical protein PHU85_00165 [Phycisphaerae bacterium]|nr:hypothetical protein [Phycisphaerae bacterium]
MAKRFFGTTATHGGHNLGEVVSVNDQASGDLIDVGWTAEEFEPGKTKWTLTIKCNGHPVVDVHDVGNLTITYKDGTTDDKGSAIVEETPKEGSLEGQVTTTYKFRKAAA